MLQWGLVVASVAVMAESSPALRIAMPANFTTQQKAMQSEVVVVGKVTGIEKESVEAEPFKGSPKVAYKIGVIKIETAVTGAKGLTHIKVGFQQPVGGTDPVPQDPQVKPGIGRPIGPIGRIQPIVLTEGQEGVFFLQKHPTENFFIIQQGFVPLDSKAPDYKTELGKVTAISATLADPLKALKAEKIEDRLLAASTLVSKYRTYPQNAQFGVDQVAIPAEESKLILKAIMEADWAKFQMDPTMNPMTLMSQLGVYAGSNGIPQYKPMPNTPNPAEAYKSWYQAEIKKWYEKSGSTFEIKKMVAKTSEK
jgi:hypothetical protein